MALEMRIHRLVTRGEWGLTCDHAGLAIGPLNLVVRQQSIKDPIYQCVSDVNLASVAAAIYEPPMRGRNEWFAERIAAIANAMTKGQHALARIAAVQLGLNAIPEEAKGALRKIATALGKSNPDWGEEPRDARGRWTVDGNDPIKVPIIAPFSPECLEAINRAMRICIDRYTAIGRYQGFEWLRKCVRSIVPVDCGY